MGQLSLQRKLSMGNICLLMIFLSSTLPLYEMAVFNLKGATVTDGKTKLKCNFAVVYTPLAVDLRKSKIACKPKNKKPLQVTEYTIITKKPKCELTLKMLITKGKGKLTHAKIGMCNSLPTLKPTPTPTPSPMTPSHEPSIPTLPPNPAAQNCTNISNLEKILTEMKQSNTDERKELDMKIQNLENQLSEVNKIAQHLLKLLEHPIEETNSTTAASTTSTIPLVTEMDFDALFIGPGMGGRDSKVLGVPSFQLTNCSPPVFPYSPHGIFWDYVARLTDAGPMFCGGVTNDFIGSSSACYLLGNNGTWVETKHMNSPRSTPAAVEVDGGWWVTGGSGESYEKLSSTEIWDGENWKNSVDLPKPLSGHCLVKINSSHVFLTAGYTNGSASTASYIYNGVDFIQVADISGHRSAPGCGLHDDYIIVVGGYKDDTTSELFSLRTLTWTEGPTSPTTRGFGSGIRITSIKGLNYIIGNNDIFLILTTAENTLEVEKVGEIFEDEDRYRLSFDAFPIKLENCPTTATTTTIA